MFEIITVSKKYLNFIKKFIGKGGNIASNLNLSSNQLSFANEDISNYSKAYEMSVQINNMKPL
jgi:predicted urease superfamily metal-dependent hydrolase